MKQIPGYVLLALLGVGAVVLLILAPIVLIALFVALPFFGVMAFIFWGMASNSALKRRRK